MNLKIVVSSNSGILPTFSLYRIYADFPKTLETTIYILIDFLSYYSFNSFNSFIYDLHTLKFIFNQSFQILFKWKCS